MEFPRFTFNPKEGIDNPALVIADDPEPCPMVVPKLCYLKRMVGQSFGFRLLMDQSKTLPILEVRDVRPRSPAEISGLKNGDRVLEMNEEFLDNVDFSRVVRRIQSCGLHLFLLVLRKEEFEEAVGSGLDLQNLARTSKGDGWSKPRLCHITRDPELGLGMTVHPVEGQKNQYMVSTVTDGPAEKAGVRNGDRLMWIYRDTASAFTRSCLNRIVRGGVDHETVVVIDSEAELCYARRKMPILPVLAQSCDFPHTAKTLHMVKGPDGYGFLLRAERHLYSQRTVPVLKEVDAGSPAEAAGMEDGDLLLAVNFEPVENLEHEDIVEKIRWKDNEVTLTCLSMHARDFYRKTGTPPLLFHHNFTLRCTRSQRESQLSKTSLCGEDRGELGCGVKSNSVIEESGTLNAHI